MSASEAVSTPPPRDARWGPGSLVRARGREWIVLSGSDAEVLRVRPVSGSEEDQTVIHVGLESVPIADASFPDGRITAGGRLRNRFRPESLLVFWPIFRHLSI